MVSRMLKDLFKKQQKNKKKDFINSIADGYVDVKAYKHGENGEKKLIYHNTGDNTITDWMRQAIMLILSGYPLSYSGNNKIDVSTESKADADQISRPNPLYHEDNNNADGYCLNGEQYLWNKNKLKDYPVRLNDEYVSQSNSGNSDNTMYALFPTKILLGTGCEYTDWQSLKDENEEENETWYHNRISEYGEGEESIAEQNFNALVGESDNDEAPSNRYSGTVSIQGIYSGSGNICRAVTVNDPDTTTNVSSSADMSKRYGVVGAIKTLYCPNEADDCTGYLKTTVDDSGRLLKGKYRGAGRPCFIYFNRTNSMRDKYKFDWDEVTSDISVQRDNATAYLNRLTFRVVIPAQSSGTGAVGEYNPFNGYVFKQVGLFNDAYFKTTSEMDLGAAGNMPCGMMLAVKNIQNFTKTADESIEFTWTLTI